MFLWSLVFGSWSFLGIHHGQRSIKNRQADNFCLGHMRAMRYAARREEKCARRVAHSRFFPITRENVNELIGIGMYMRRDRHPSMKFTQNGNAAGLLVPMKRHEFDAGIRAGLPLFVFD